SQDAEDTRELLTRYFEVARTTIERYGGTVEKFIGDAVMAVWGAPVAQEDDAERSVRAALELVAAVPALDPSLHARAGVLSGGGAGRAAGRRHRDRRHRQVTARLGVREVRRRPGSRGALAPRSLSLLWRRCRLLGARRDGAHAMSHPRGRRAGVSAREAAART